MTSLWSRDEALAATGGKAEGGDWAATGVSIDSRSVIPGDLFVALKDQRDGHQFVAAALAAGAVAALVTHRPPDVAKDAGLLIVPDVLEGLEALARAARARTAARIIAVTGSVGKTGTKDMLRTALASQGKVHAAERSYNNHWGVPLTLARMAQDTDYAVLEIGMNHPGEITPLSTLSRPHVVIITTVALVHAQAFDSVLEIADAKAEIFDGLEPQGTAIINRDVETYPRLLRRARKRTDRIVRFGATGRPEYRLTEAHVRPGATTIRARIRGERTLLRLGAPGRHLAMNALAVLAGVEALGADRTRAAIALGAWQAPDGRGARYTLERGIAGIDGYLTLIDESYNANPTSMAAALEVLGAAVPNDDMGRVARGRRIAFLGDMLELGPDELAMHAALADLPVMRSITRVHCVGERMRALHDALPPSKRGEWFKSSERLAARVGRLIDAGDVAMVKGSLGSRMAVVIDAFRLLGTLRPETPADPTSEEI